jgi:DNA-binding MarR family transcriptional regulator
MAEPASAAAKLQDLNQVIHERTRLVIMTFLISARESTFTFSEIKDALRLTDGNLNLHMKVLEKNGFVIVEKVFVNRRPRTSYRLTREGHRAFRNYVSLLESVLGLGK